MANVPLSGVDETSGDPLMPSLFGNIEIGDNPILTISLDQMNIPFIH